MPRQGRVDFPGSLHHIICRGIERRDIFSDDVDRDNFVSRLIELTTISSTRCFAWALMPNHLHLLLQTGEYPISSLMQKLLGGYATTFNLRHHRWGHLFQNRYKSILCQEETYLLELVRYIHLNPLRAGLVPSFEALSEFRYCGHGCLLGRNRDLLSWMATEEVLERFGNNLGESRQAYESFALDGVAMGRRPDLTGGGLPMLCHVVKSWINGSWPSDKNGAHSDKFAVRYPYVYQFYNSISNVIKGGAPY